MNHTLAKGLRTITQAAVVAALYAVLTILSSLLGLGFGPIQFRISEFMTILPIFTPAAIPGLTIGCFLSNLGSPLGVIDWVFGSAATLTAALLTYRLRNIRFKNIPVLSAFAPVLVNALVVGAESACLTPGGFTFAVFATVGLQVGLSELIICFALGLPFAATLEKTGAAKKIF